MQRKNILLGLILLIFLLSLSFFTYKMLVKKNSLSNQQSTQASITNQTPKELPQVSQNLEASSSVLQKITTLISDVVVSTTSSSKSNSSVLTPYIPATTTDMSNTALQSSIVWTPPSPGGFATSSYVFATSTSLPVVYTPPMGTTSIVLGSNGSIPQQPQVEKPSSEKLLTSIEGWGTATGKQTDVLKKAVKMYNCKTVNCLTSLQADTSSYEQNNFLNEAILVHSSIIKALLANSATTTENLKTLKSIVSGYDKIMPSAYASRSSEPSNYELSVIVASLSYGFLYSHLDIDSYGRVTDGIHPQQYVLEATKLNTDSKNSSGLKNVLDILFAFLR